MRQSEIRKLRNFLREKGVWDSFKKYYKRARRVRGEDPRITPFLASVDAVDALLTAFPWNETEEGIGFWVDLHYEWTELIEGGKRDD